MYNFTNNELQQIINDYVHNLLSYKEIMKKYNIKSRSKVKSILGNNSRTLSEANKIAHKKHPSAFKLSDEAKNKIRTARLKFMKEHPEQTAWRKTNISYPEKMFIKFLNERGYSDKFLIERELSVYPYYIDFAFVDLKIAVEIDGSQHLKKDRKIADSKKDKLLQDNGWVVIRVAENVVKTNWTLLEDTLNKYINKECLSSFERVGIVKTIKERKKKRNSNGKTDKQQQRIDEFYASLPDKNILLEQITNKSFCEVGRIYGVSDNAIRKWCKKLNIPHKRSLLKK